MSTEKGTHTPLPWVNGHWGQHDCIEIGSPNWVSGSADDDMVRVYPRRTPGGSVSAEMVAEAGANAELIVRAVNSHEVLVSACSSALEWITDKREEECWCYDEVDGAPDSPPPGRCLACHIRSALAKAKPPKRKVVKVELLWKEGKHGHMLPSTFASIQAANERLAWFALDAPTGGAYDKTGFRITWEDGYSHEGRYDLHNSDERQDNLNGRVDLADHVRGFATFYAGLRQPGHISDEQYQTFLASLDPQRREALRSFLENYEL